jgi:hypothetical protein
MRRKAGSEQVADIDHLGQAHAEPPGIVAQFLQLAANGRTMSRRIASNSPIAGRAWPTETTTSTGTEKIARRYFPSWLVLRCSSSGDSPGSLAGLGELAGLAGRGSFSVGGAAVSVI